MRRRIDFRLRSRICSPFVFRSPPLCTSLTPQCVQMISKSVGKTSIRTRKMKSAFQTSSTRKATEIEQQNHRQTSATFHTCSKLIR